MKPGRSTKLLIEPPSTATGDIVFNLIVFFLVMVSDQPQSGREQTLPRSEETEQEKQESENIEVLVSRNFNIVTINADPILMSEAPRRLKGLLTGKVREEDKVVVMKSKPETPYFHWIAVTEMIEQAGGIITIQREEEREVVLPN